MISHKDVPMSRKNVMHEQLFVREFDGNRTHCSSALGKSFWQILCWNEIQSDELLPSLRMQQLYKPCFLYQSHGNWLLCYFRQYLDVFRVCTRHGFFRFTLPEKRLLWSWDKSLNIGRCLLRILLIVHAFTFGSLNGM